LVIDQTEAMTVIDVNTGKYVGTSDLRHTIIDTNVEAAREIAKQLRLRAIGGIVIVDFIDMDYAEDKQKLLDYLGDLFKGTGIRRRSMESPNWAWWRSPASVPGRT